MKNLVKHDMITEEKRENIEQTEECLTITLKRSDAILVRDDLVWQDKMQES